MDTYNENLRASVATLLQGQELELKKVQAEADASMFTLYYAQGAAQVANDRLVTTKKIVNAAAVLNRSAVENNDLLQTNLSTVTMVDSNVKQSVTDAAVSASNVQIAATAVIRLASDIGSIYNIAQASGMDTEISHYATEVMELMKDTAYDAEKASQLAMEASVLTAEISTASVSDKVKTANTSMGALLKILSADLASAEQANVSAQASLDQARASAMQANGKFTNIDTANTAINNAYRLLIAEVNLALQVQLPDNYEGSGFNVSFNLIKSPFTQKNAADHYPVKDYYLILVKDKAQTNFTLASAENIIADHSERCISLSGLMGAAVKDGSFSSRFDIYGTGAKKNEVVLKNANGDKIETGTDYVVFLVAILMDEYKKAINVFDDFISIPSSSFRLAKELAIATGLTVTKTGITPCSIGFAVDEHSGSPVAYRCILLEADDKGNVGFYFNLRLAEQLSPGNYTEAIKTKNAWTVNIGASATDNFGKRLVKGTRYIPVVISVSTSEMENLSKFINSWTGIDVSHSFVY